MKTAAPATSLFEPLHRLFAQVRAELKRAVALHLQMCEIVVESYRRD